MPTTAGVLVMIGLVLGLLFPYFESTRNANERPRLLQGIARVDDGAWFLDVQARRHDPGPDTARNPSTGHLYPNKPPGTSAVAAVAYRVARATTPADEPLTMRRYTWWARMATGWLPTILLCGVLLRRFRLRGTATAAAVILYACGTPAATYAHLAYGHQLAAALLGIGMVWLVDARGGDDTASPTSVGGRAALAAVGGLLAGAAVAVEYAAAFAALPIGVMLLSGLASKRHRAGAIVATAAGLGGALVSIVALMRYHVAAFGSPWSTGYHHATNAGFAAKHAEGLLGLRGPSWEGVQTHLLSADGGLLWWAPLFVLAIYGLMQMAKDGPHRTEARLHLSVVLLYLLLTCSLSFEGGWRVGPRYMVIALPSLVLGWAWVMGQFKDRPLAFCVMVALTVYSIVVNGLAANLWPHLDLTHVHQPVAEVLLPLWRADFRPYDPVGRTVGVDGLSIVLSLPILVWLIVSSRLIDPGWRVAIATVLGVGIGLGAVAATGWITPAPRSKANLAYIERQWEPTAERPEGRSSVIVAPRAKTR
jgi:hypothetical protein